MLSHHRAPAPAPTPLMTTIREVIIHVVENFDAVNKIESLAFSSPDPDLRVDPDFITYQLGKADPSLQIRFLFPTEVGENTLELQPLESTPSTLEFPSPNTPVLPFNATLAANLLLTPVDPAKKPKAPVGITIRVRPKGGGEA